MMTPISKYFFYPLIFLLFFIEGQAFQGNPRYLDQIQELEKEIARSQIDTTKVKTLYKLIDVVVNAGDKNKAIQLLNTAFEIVDYQNQKDLVNKLYQLRTKLYIEDYDIAIKHLNEHLLDESQFDTISKAHAYNSLSVAHYYKGDYRTAIVNSFKATRLFEIEDKKYALLNSYSNLGHLYHKTNQYQKAINQLQNTIKLSDSLGRNYVKSTALNNIGLVYFDIKENDSALFYLRQSERTKIQLKSTNLASTYHSLSNVLLEMERFDEALSYLNQALALNKKSDNKNGIVHDYMSLGDYFFQQKNYKSAKLNYTDGLSVAEITKNFDLIVQLKFKLGDVYRLSGDYKKALQVRDEAHILKDSLNDQKHQSIAIEAQVKYETEKKERELAQTKQKLAEREHELELHKWLRIFGITATVALLLIIYLVKHKSRAQKILSDQKNQSIQSALDRTKLQLASKQKEHEQLEKALENRDVKDKSDLKKELDRSEKELKDLQIFHDLRETMKQTMAESGADVLQVKQLKEMISNLFIEEKQKTLIVALKSKFPSLSEEDLRLAAAIKQHLLNQEMAMFLQVSTNTLYTRKSRLKQKLNLEQKDDLSKFIHEFEI
ncbi:tetratricopeptide repeat protein [Flavobacteriaceae bacterium R38]|nr:tetratricopeptide repeat protein [Flavobacteriaceae bacterium R38]